MTNNNAHTPGPWYEHNTTKDYRDITNEPDGNGNSIAHVYHDNSAANAARIVACVNGCEGINPEAVKEMLEACEKTLEQLQLIGPVMPMLTWIVGLLSQAIAHATGEKE